MNTSREKRGYRVISPEGDVKTFEIIVPTHDELQSIIASQHVSRSPPSKGNSEILQNLKTVGESIREKILEFGLGRIFLIILIIAVVCFLGFIVTPKWLIPWIEEAAKVKKGGEYLQLFFVVVGIWIMTIAVASIVTICRDFDEKSKDILVKCFYYGAIGIGGLIIAAGAIFLILALIEAIIKLVKIIIGLIVVAAILVGWAESSKK